MPSIPESRPRVIIRTPSVYYSRRDLDPPISEELAQRGWFPGRT